MPPALDTNPWDVGLMRRNKLNVPRGTVFQAEQKRSVDKGPGLCDPPGWYEYAVVGYYGREGKYLVVEAAEHDDGAAEYFMTLFSEKEIKNALSEDHKDRALRTFTSCKRPLPGCDAVGSLIVTPWTRPPPEEKKEIIPDPKDGLVLPKWKPWPPSIQKKLNSTHKVERGTVFLFCQAHNRCEYSTSRLNVYVKTYEGKGSACCSAGLHEYVVANYDPREDKYYCFEAQSNPLCAVLFSGHTIVKAVAQYDNLKSQSKISFDNVYPTMPEIDKNFKVIGPSHLSPQKVIIDGSLSPRHPNPNSPGTELPQDGSAPWNQQSNIPAEQYQRSNIPPEQYQRSNIQYGQSAPIPWTNPPQGQWSNMGSQSAPNQWNPNPNPQSQWINPQTAQIQGNSQYLQNVPNMSTNSQNQHQNPTQHNHPTQNQNQHPTQNPNHHQNQHPTQNPNHHQNQHPTQWPNPWHCDTSRAAASNTRNYAALPTPGRNDYKQTLNVPSVSSQSRGATSWLPPQGCPPQSSPQGSTPQGCPPQSSPYQPQGSTPPSPAKYGTPFGRQNMVAQPHNDQPARQMHPVVSNFRDEFAVEHNPLSAQNLRPPIGPILTQPRPQVSTLQWLPPER